MNYIQTKKFNEVNISIRCVFDLKKEDVTKFHILMMMMKSKCEKYPTKQALSSALSDAYGTRAFFGLTGYGKKMMFEHRFQYIHSSLIDEESYIGQVKEIMDQFLFHSLMDKETLEEAKYLLRNKLIRMEDDPDSLSVRLAFNQIENSSIAIQVQGYLEDIDDIQLEEIQTLYQEYLSKDKNVYVCGDVEEEIMSYLQGIDADTEMDIEYENLNTDKVYKKEIEKDISQTSLAQLYQTGVQIESEDYYPLLVMNSVLGQSPCNILFKEVRENNSLCYSINSSLIRFDGGLLIHTGTFEEALDKVQELIAELIQKIAKKEITEEELAISKMDIIDGLISGTDNPNALIQQAFLNEILKRDYDVYGIVERIQAVTLDDIARIASQLKLVSTGIVKEMK